MAAGGVKTRKSVGMLPNLSLISTSPLSAKMVIEATVPAPRAISGAGMKGETFRRTLLMAKVARARAMAYGLMDAAW
ncbi:hypothetical protein D3C72_1709230 [compost metagenome]